MPPTDPKPAASTQSPLEDRDGTWGGTLYGNLSSAGAAGSDHTRGGSYLPVPSLPPVAPSAPHLEGLPDKYEELGPLGAGGMGEVWQVYDRTLQRSVALKIIGAGIFVDEKLLSQFEKEARVTAQLQHPGIVPVHEIGRLEDGRAYFTMKEIHGRTLRDVILEVHRAAANRQRATESGWTFRRLVDAFHRVCETVAFAHARGVVHRDLKPQNIMVGEFGEVLLMDWGLATVLNAPGSGRPHGGGTPAYMPPELAMGRVELIGPKTDVYGLGAVLFEMLSGHPPFLGRSAREILDRVAHGVMEDIHGPLLIPAELETIARTALAREPKDRYEDAAGLARAVGDWLEGARKQEQALALINEADALLPKVDLMRRDAEDLRQQARRLLDPLRPHDPVDRKRPGWALEDEAAALEREARLEELRYVQKLHNALNVVPELNEAHHRLAEHHHDELVRAERARDSDEATRQELLLRQHDRGQYAAFLRGDGALTLITEPEGADVALFRYTLRDRRLEPVFERLLGRTPLREVSLSRGSYLLVLRAPGHAEVRYPVLIERASHWDGVPPGEREPRPIPLPRLDELGPEDRYVPPGWFRSGGDMDGAEALSLRRLWVDGVVFRRFPVTNVEYLEFLDALVDGGREEEALRYAPALLGATGASPVSSQVLTRDAAGHFQLAQDNQGVAWQPRHPVVYIDWHAASAYAAWLAARTGRVWRLPHDQEWEKAARGVDGRFFPWGDFPEPTWSCNLQAHDGPPRRCEVDPHEADEGPYGLRSMAGLTRAWCINRYSREGLPDGARVVPDAPPADDPDFRMVRGGAWASVLQHCRCGARFANRPEQRFHMLGIRLCSSFTRR